MRFPRTSNGFAQMLERIARDIRSGRRELGSYEISHNRDGSFMRTDTDDHRFTITSRKRNAPKAATR